MVFKTESTCQLTTYMTMVRLSKQIDNKRMKGEVQDRALPCKEPFFNEKRVHGLPAELLSQQAVIFLRMAITKLLLNVSFAQATLAHRGWNPFNRATLVGGVTHTTTT